LVKDDDLAVFVPVDPFELGDDDFPKFKLEVLPESLLRFLDADEVDSSSPDRTLDCASSSWAWSDMALLACPRSIEVLDIIPLGFEALRSTVTSSPGCD
jgi:hypothetical protein